MKAHIIAVVVAAALVGGTGRARAEDIVAYQADGDADASASDARVAALDEAFGKAVSQALVDLLDPEVRRQHKPAIDRELLGHARLWVARFTVTREAVADDRKQLAVSVRVDRDKLRVRLTELGIALKAGDAPAAVTEPAIVLLRVAAPEGVRATYGLSAEPDVPGLAALSGVLRRTNLAIKRAPAAGPAASPEGDLPLDDDTAEALGAEAKAAVVAIAGVAVGAPVPLRGVAASGVLVTAHVRLLDRRGQIAAGGNDRKARKVIGQGSVVTAARGSDPGIVGYAIDRALAAAITDAQPVQSQPLAQAQAYSGSEAPVGDPGVVLVRLARNTPWGLVQSELKHLMGARGVTSATLRHVSPAGWVIGVATAESVERIASIVKKPPAVDTAVSVKVIGDVVEATLSGAP